MNNRIGFGLLELLIVIALMGLLGAIIVPNLRRVTPRYERQDFIARFNALVQLGWRNALIQHKTYQITVDIAKKHVSLLVESQEKGRKAEKQFKKSAELYDTSIAWPETLQVKQFFVEGFDMMAQFVSKPTAEIWFYIVPEGMAQDVIINLVDTKDLKDNLPRAVSLVLNPFNAQFKVYDTFQKP